MLDRNLDIFRQGFMKARLAPKAKRPMETVACDDCMNWHRKGHHTADAATRKANRQANKERLARMAS